MNAWLHDWRKKLRFAANFARRRLVHVNLQILYTCDFRCAICDFWRPPHQEAGRLTRAEVEHIARQLDQIGPQIVSIGGGEPLLHPELEPMVRALAERHLPVMITNGWHLTPARARALFAAGMMEISVSVDYADPRRHDAQRGRPGAHARALEALRMLHENRTRADQRVHMISVVMDDNLDEIEPLIEACERLGITYLVTLYSHSRGAKPLRPMPREVSRRLLDLKRRYRGFVALRGYLSKFTEACQHGGIGPCFAGRHLCNIDSRGQVTLCIDRLAEPIGNILTDDMNVLADRLLARHRTNTCRDCWTSCRGSIEALLYGPWHWLNLLDYWQMARPVALGGRF